jgi:hypothetical protein
MNSFAQYLETHQIEPLQLSVVAGVRYLTVWNALQGYPITEAHAQQIRAAIKQLTGQVYAGTPLTVKEATRKTFPLLPIRKLPTR